MKKNLIIGAIVLCVIIVITLIINSNIQNDSEVTGAGNVLSLTTDDAVAKHVTTTSGNTKTALDVAITASYSSTTNTITDGDISTLQLDINGNLKSTMATQLAGEDLTNDVLKVEQRFNYDYQAAAAANNVVKATAGFLHAIVVGTASSTATDIIEVSDHASDGDGNVKILLTDAPVGTYIIDASFNTGITTDTTVQTDVTFIYR